MKIIDMEIEDVKLIIPDVYGDNRGWYSEVYNEKRYFDNGITAKFVQDNMSFSAKANTIRGMHWQDGEFAQAKLVYVVSGAVLDVAVDIREGSKTYGKWVCAILSSTVHNQLFIPRGFAHGFQTITNNVVFGYKVDNFYNKESERGFIWNDPTIGIDWDLNNITISEKDNNHPLFSNITPWKA